MKLFGTNRHSAAELCADVIFTESAQESKVDANSKQELNGDIRFACDVGNENEDCSTSDVSHQETCSRRLRRSRDHASRQRRRKRWRGRVENLEYAFDTPLPEATKQDLVSSTLDTSEDGCGEKQVILSYTVMCPNIMVIELLMIIFCFSGFEKELLISACQ